MCGVAGFYNLRGLGIRGSQEKLELMSTKLSHRGPDGKGSWLNENQSVGLAHTRLSIIDPSSRGSQPMQDLRGNVLVFNGEIYNYLDLRGEEKARGGFFNSDSDSEVILSEYRQDSEGFVSRLRGMFALAIWDSSIERLTLVRDRLGIKPLYFAVVDEVLFFASEPKALLPFMPSVQTDHLAMGDYLAFQSLLRPETPFLGISQVMPGQKLTATRGEVKVETYWRVQYELNFDRSEEQTLAELKALVEESVDLHLVSDVEVGAYLSGGIDSSLIASLAAERASNSIQGFHGRFTSHPGYDESGFARQAAEAKSIDLIVTDFSPSESWEAFVRAVYHLDFPIAGPGSIPQFLVSQVASTKVKVVLGGQGGDELFGGYARYLIAYLEQCLRASIDGTASNGNFVVTLASIIPNLRVLEEYKPMLQRSWSSGLFGNLEDRYLQMVGKKEDMGQSVNWEALNMESTYSAAVAIFNDVRSVKKEALFDSMTHFDLKTLLPALLHVEDRMSMASGLESRVPLLDHKLVEFAATIPADIKFKDGNLKRLLKLIGKPHLPETVMGRRDKMGFPVPLNEWASSEWQSEIKGLLENLRDRKLEYLVGDQFETLLVGSLKFSRGVWALMCVEMWMSHFHDNQRNSAAQLP